MKVNINAQIEIDDQQRKALAALIDGGKGRNRMATRDEIKDYAWTHGSLWWAALESGELNRGVEMPVVDLGDDLLGADDDDLLGSPDDDEGEDLL